MRLWPDEKENMKGILKVNYQIRNTVMQLIRGELSSTIIVKNYYIISPAFTATCLKKTAILMFGDVWREEGRIKVTKPD